MFAPRVQKPLEEDCFVDIIEHYEDQVRGEVDAMTNNFHELKQVRHPYASVPPQELLVLLLFFHCCSSVALPLFFCLAVLL